MITNTQTIQQAYAAIAGQNMPSLQRLIARDIVWIVPEMSGVPFAGEWRGQQGVAQFFARLEESQEIVEFQPVQFVAQKATVVVLGHFVMRVKATARLSRSEWAHLWTLRDGLIVRMQEYVDTAAVRAAHAA
jgi:ketosteroid isomerase-like protein